MMIQITTILIAMSTNHLLYADQKWIFIVAYALALILASIYIIPYFISPNAQSGKTMKFNYSLLFGSLAFFVSIILIYAINTFAGLDFNNYVHYLSTILVPAILATNFVFGPIIYYLLTKNSKFY